MDASMSTIEPDENVADQSDLANDEVIVPNPQDMAPARGGVFNRAVRESQLEVNAGIHRLLGILVVLGTLYTCYFASELILPILLAAFFALLLSPVMKRLSSSWLPRWIAAFLLIAISMATLVGIGNALYVPAAQWAGRAPRVIHNVAPKIKSLIRPITEANKMGDSLSEIAGTRKKEVSALSCSRRTGPLCFQRRRGFSPAYWRWSC